jgi:RES domain
VSPLGPPPSDLGGFPAQKLESDQLLYRIHRSDRSPWWFSNDGSGRFDLLGGDNGTCYLAERPVGAFIEVFRTGTVIPEAEVNARRLAEARTPSTTTLADCMASEARSFGVTGAIHSQPDYELTRAWAQALAVAGFDGVLYRLSHDPSGSEIGVALFGDAGERDLPIESTGAIPDDVLEEARVRFGLLVLPTPGS